MTKRPTQVILAQRVSISQRRSMDSRAAGYITEIGYTHSYTPDLAPGQLGFALLNGGVVTHAARPLRYLELGFGQGLSLAIHAAASPGDFWGVDINPEHVA